MPKFHRKSVRSRGRHLIWVFGIFPFNYKHAVSPPLALSCSFLYSQILIWWAAFAKPKQVTDSIVSRQASTILNTLTASPKANISFSSECTRSQSLLKKKTNNVITSSFLIKTCDLWMYYQLFIERIKSLLVYGNHPEVRLPCQQSASLDEG